MLATSPITRQELIKLVELERNAEDRKSCEIQFDNFVGVCNKSYVTTFDGMHINSVVAQKLINMPRKAFVEKDFIEFPTTTETTLFSITQSLREYAFAYSYLYYKKDDFDITIRDACYVMASLSYTKYGYQLIQFKDANFCAHMLATNFKDSMDRVHLPWPSFILQVPEGILYNKEHNIGVTAIAVTQCTDYLICVVVLSNQQVLNIVSKNIQELIVQDWPKQAMQLKDDVFYMVYSKLALLALRLVPAVCFALTNKELVKTYVPTPNIKHKALGVRKDVTNNTTLHVVGKPINVDAKEFINCYINGAHKGTGTPHSVSTFVMGHLRQQAVGPRVYDPQGRYSGDHREEFIYCYKKGGKNDPMVKRPHIITATGEETCSINI